MRVTQNMIDRNLVFGIHQSHDRLSRLSDQLSTGQRVNALHDDVPSAVRILQLQRENDRLDVFLGNLGTVDSMLSVATNALTRVSESLSRVREFGVQAANETYTDSNRQVMAEGVDALLETMLSASNVTHRGSYVFAGEAVGTTPFQATRDAAGELTAVSYRGEVVSTEIRVGPRQVEQVNLVGSDHIQGTTDLFGTTIALRDAIRAGDLDEVRRLTEALGECHDEVRTSLGKLGERQSQLHMLRNASEGFRDLNKRVISDHRDADIAEVSVAFNAQMVLLQTVLKVAAQAIRPSLANFMSA